MLTLAMTNVEMLSRPLWNVSTATTPPLTSLVKSDAWAAMITLLTSALFKPDARVALVSRNVSLLALRLPPQTAGTSFIDSPSMALAARPLPSEMTPATSSLRAVMSKIAMPILLWLQVSDEVKDADGHEKIEALTPCR
jgi:hypothetical protein